MAKGHFIWKFGKSSMNLCKPSKPISGSKPSSLQGFLGTRRTNCNNSLIYNCNQQSTLSNPNFALATIDVTGTIMSPTSRIQSIQIGLLWGEGNWIGIIILLPLHCLSRLILMKRHTVTRNKVSTLTVLQNKVKQITILNAELATSIMHLYTNKFY